MSVNINWNICLAYTTSWTDEQVEEESTHRTRSIHNVLRALDHRSDVTVKRVELKKKQTRRDIPTQANLYGPVFMTMTFEASITTARLWCTTLVKQYYMLTSESDRLGHSNMKHFRWMMRPEVRLTCLLSLTTYISTTRVRELELAGHRTLRRVWKRAHVTVMYSIHVVNICATKSTNPVVMRCCNMMRVVVVINTCQVFKWLVQKEFKKSSNKNKSFFRKFRLTTLEVAFNLIRVAKNKMASF